MTQVVEQLPSKCNPQYHTHKNIPQSPATRMQIYNYSLLRHNHAWLWFRSYLWEETAKPVYLFWSVLIAAEVGCPLAWWWPHCSFLTGKEEARQVWDPCQWNFLGGQFCGVVLGFGPSSGVPAFSSVKWKLCHLPPAEFAHAMELGRQLRVRQKQQWSFSAPGLKEENRNQKIEHSFRE
jgi:hypothetical protein